jgi:hypothetical protein
MIAPAIGPASDAAWARPLPSANTSMPEKPAPVASIASAWLPSCSQVPSSLNG